MLEKRLRVANLPTPIQMLQNLSELLELTFYIKRDDFTGMELSGNKVRKLEYIMSEVVNLGYDTVITCGGPQSNHARTTSYLANQLGIDCHLVLAKSKKELSYTGNYFLNDLACSRLEWIDEEEFDESYLNKYMDELAREYLKYGKNAYCIPLGASNSLGNLGYMNCVKEIKNQIPRGIKFDRIVVTVGSGGTYAGLLLGIKKFMPDVKLTGINVRKEREYFIDYISKIANETIDEFDLELEEIHSSEIDIIDGYVGEGYRIPSDDEITFIKNIIKKEGIIFDPTYTGKAAYGFYKEVMKGRFKGETILFIHTGGQMGVFGSTDYF
jgi:D-cysteine desulfhydrase